MTSHLSHSGCSTPRRHRPLVAAAVFTAAALLSAPAQGEDAWVLPSWVPEPAHSITVPERPPEPTFLENIGREADRTHERLERGILHQAIRLDDFFGTTTPKKEPHTGYLLRWRNNVRLEKGGKLKLGSSARLDVQLSRIDERLRLTFSGENEPDPFAPRLPEDPGTPGFDRTFQNARLANTELRFQFIRSPSTEFFAGVGLDITWPPQVFFRSRYQYLRKLSEVAIARFAETLFAKSSDGPGETSELSLERALNRRTLLRWSNLATVSEEVRGLEWGSELSLLRELSTKSAVTATTGIYGNNHSDDVISNYRVLLRYRRNFLRPWLFCELEPEVSWPRQADDSFSTTYAVTFRLEVVFQGKEMRPVAQP